MAVDSSAAGLSIPRTSATLSNGEPGLFHCNGSDLAREQRLTLFGVAAVAERATLGTERSPSLLTSISQPSET